MTRKGKLIFSDDFAGPDIDGKWARPKGNWSIADGALKGGERKEDRYSGSSKASFDFNDAVLQFDLKFDGAGKCGFAIDSAKGHVGRLTIAPNGFTIQKDGSTSDPADPRRVLDTAAFEFEPGKWYTIMVEVSGDEILARVDDRHCVLGADPKFDRHKTRIAFGVHGESIHVDNVRAFAATPNPEWPSLKAKLREQHAPPPARRSPARTTTRTPRTRRNGRRRPKERNDRRPGSGVGFPSHP
jgi:hypothetical protein